MIRPTKSWSWQSWSWERPRGSGPAGCAAARPRARHRPATSPAGHPVRNRLRRAPNTWLPPGRTVTIL
ncbi:hypothetical protein SFR_4095 [Streptomyces sp. FR-008]|nr:hypothetical protein SFR_4095 [Streptomyces sp. FR-008]